VTNLLVIDKFAEIYRERLAPQFPGVAIHTAVSPDAIPLDLAAVDVLLAFGISVDDALIARAKRLKWIQSLATGVDHFLRCPSLKPETILTSARGIHGPAMRESVIYLMTMLNHQTARLVRNQAAHRWDRGPPWPLLKGKTAVVAGIGVGGVAIGQMLKAFEMRVVGVSRTPRAIDGFDQMIHTDRLAEATRGADYLINILPGSADNIGLIDRKVLAAMKPSAFFINVGRGETVDEPALIAALRENRIAGAGLDVFQTEPLPAESPFWDLPNVFICPHLGGFFSEYEDYVLPLVTENLRLFLAGRYGEMKNIVPH
jgi:D-2-hydroxyacid dehydrogenase (NADP+)